MSEFGEWDESTVVAAQHKAIPVLIHNMSGMMCRAFSPRSGWGHIYTCARNGGHSGRHMAIERLGRYPTAVWH